MCYLCNLLFNSLFFAKSLPNGHDDIEGLRIIRDPSTLVGKGIGYLLFRDRDCVLKALALHKVCVCNFKMFLYSYICICEYVCMCVYVNLCKLL